MAEYSPSSFYCEGSDKKGHGRQIRIHPDSHGQVAVILANTDLPYNTYEDFVRDAVVHRWHWLAEHTDDPQIKKYAKLLESQAGVEAQQNLVAAERKLVASFRASLATADTAHYVTRAQLTEALTSCETPSLKQELALMLGAFF